MKRIISSLVVAGLLCMAIPQKSEVLLPPKHHSEHKRRLRAAYRLLIFAGASASP